MLVTNVGDDTMLRPDRPPARGRTAGRRGTKATRNRARPRVHKRLTISKASTPLQEKLYGPRRTASAWSATSRRSPSSSRSLRPRAVGRRSVGWPAGRRRRREGAVRERPALLSYFVYMVIIIVVAVPEGLPMSVTVSLAIAWRKMSSANSLVRQLVACETIGLGQRSSAPTRPARSRRTR